MEFSFLPQMRGFHTHASISTLSSDNTELLSVRDLAGRSPLEFAASMGDLALLQSLLALGAPLAPREGALTALHLALLPPPHCHASAKALPMVTALAGGKAGLPPAAVCAGAAWQGSSGVTPLHLAALHPGEAGLELVRFLLARGAQPSARAQAPAGAAGGQPELRSAEDWALGAHNEAVAALLKATPASTQPRQSTSQPRQSTSQPP